jgi:hypothetical protein
LWIRIRKNEFGSTTLPFRFVFQTEPGIIDTGGDSEADKAAADAAANGMGSLFDDYPSLDAALPDVADAVAAAVTVTDMDTTAGGGGASGTEETAANTSTEGDDNGQETTLETPPPSIEVAGGGDTGAEQHLDTVADEAAAESAEASVTEGGESAAGSGGENEPGDNEGWQSVSLINARTVAEEEEGGSSDKPENAAAAGDEGEGTGSGEEFSEQAGPWSATEKEDEGNQSMF